MNDLHTKSGRIFILSYRLFLRVVRSFTEVENHNFVITTKRSKHEMCGYSTRLTYR